MDQEFYGLPMEIESEDGKLYTLSVYQPTVQSVDFLWREAAKYEFLFSDATLGDPERFVQYLLSPGVMIFLVSCEEEPVGILYADQVREGIDARVHYLFWDRHPKGRQRLLLTAMRWFLDTFELHRFNMEIPVYAFAALRRMKKMGIRIEGRRRQGIFFRGKWQDLLLFGVTRSELSDAALTSAKLARTAEEADWFGVYSSDSIFSIALAKED